MISEVVENISSSREEFLKGLSGDGRVSSMELIDELEKLSPEEIEKLVELIRSGKLKQLTQTV